MKPTVEPDNVNQLASPFVSEPKSYSIEREFESPLRGQNLLFLLQMVDLGQVFQSGDPDP